MNDQLDMHRGNRLLHELTPPDNPNPFHDQPGPKPRLWRCTEEPHAPQ